MGIAVAFGGTVAVIPNEVATVLVTVAVCWWCWRRPGRRR